MRIIHYAFTAILLASSLSSPSYAQPTGRVQFVPDDSVEIDKLLREASQLPTDCSRILFFARKFVGRPYVGGTLDKNKEERLVVNLRQWDCTTFVETVASLALASAKGGLHFADFTRQLRHLRYRDGLISYTTRLHYFSWWIEEQVKHHRAIEITPHETFTGRRRLNLYYMSHHPDRYPMLRHRPQRADSIRTYEKASCGKSFSYLPSARLANDTLLRDAIHDGDIIATVTRRGGLDIAHLGFAVWGTDGHLHLLNASSLRHAVVEERRTLSEYLERQPNILGIRVIRLWGT